MNERYLFRGRRETGIDKGEWIIGYYTGYDRIANIKSISNREVEIDSATLGQCTAEHRLPTNHLYYRLIDKLRCKWNIFMS